MAMFPTARLCSCGSGEWDEEVFDARGIYLTRCCDQCRKDRLAQFRPEVFDDPGYDTFDDVVDGDSEPDWGGPGSFDGVDGDYPD